MPFTIDNRKALIALAIVVAFVAVMVPSCRMVGCSMEMGSVADMAGMHMGGSFFSDTCGGSYVTNSAPVGVVPAGADSLVIALVTAVLAAVALMRPQVVARPIRVHDSDPPPPPEEPRGERFRV